MLSGLKDGITSDNYKEVKAILEGLGEIREKDEPDFRKCNTDWIDFLHDPSLRV